MTDRPTPETDEAAAGEINQGSAMAYVRAVDLARKLERERDELREKVRAFLPAASCAIPHPSCSASYEKDIAELRKLTEPKC